MRRINRAISLFLLSVLILSTAASCSGKQDNATGNGNAVTGTSAKTAAAETELSADVKAVNCGGKDFIILSRQKTDTYNAHPYDEFTADTQTGDVLNDAVYMRNLAIEEKYNVNIVSETNTDVKAQAQKTILAGDDRYAFISLGLRYAFSLAVQNYLYDINTVPHLDFTKPWWMSNILEDTSIAGKSYFVSGDLNIAAFNTAGITYFNKKLVEQYKLDDPYKTVTSGAWTIDKLTEMARAVTGDLDGNGVFDAKDRYGLEASSFAWQPLFYGTDNLMIKKDSADIPYFDADNEKNYGSIEKIVKLLNDKTASLNVNHLSGFSDLGQLTVDIFNEGRALFFIELIYGVPPLRNMENDFGLLPMPKFDEKQDEYATYLHTSNASSIAVPVTNKDIDTTGRILEDMAYQSYKQIRPVFYDIMLKGKFARDEQSAEMLDIIYSNINIDLALVMIDYGITIDTQLRSACTDNKTDIMSTLASLKDSYNSKINEAITVLTGGK